MRLDRVAEQNQNGRSQVGVSSRVQFWRDVPFAEEVELPDQDVLAHTQYLHAIDRLNEDKSLYPRFKRLESVHGLTGAFAPEELIFVAAGTGNGKSLLCQNLFDDLIEQKIPSLYIGTEQSPDVLKIKHACIRCGVSPRLMLKPEVSDQASAAYQLARGAVEAELKWLDSPERRELAYYANSEYINRFELTRWITGGVKRYGIECVIVDHIDQVNHGEGFNSVHELTQTVHHLHDLARENQIPIVAASQIKRVTDPLKRYAPPDGDDLAGSAGKERVMAVGIGLWRPLRTDLPITELRDLLKRAKQGSTSQDRIYQPDTMGVRLLKDRLGAVPGKQAMLYVGKGGRLSDDPGLTHGIKSGPKPVHSAALPLLEL
jgi:archaellum biogenesis ATPase FlaH